MGRLLPTGLQTVLFSILFIPLLAVPFKPYYWTTRRLECKSTSGHDTARCALHTEDTKLELNPGCFDDTDNKGKNRIYCRIMCEESDDTTVLAKLPNWNHQCNMFYTYNLQRFRRDWYLWRSEDCLNTTITFEVRCGFSRDPRKFYRNNEQLFLAEDELDKRETIKVGRL